MMMIKERKDKPKTTTRPIDIKLKGSNENF